MRSDWSSTHRFSVIMLQNTFAFSISSRRGNVVHVAIVIKTGSSNERRDMVVALGGHIGRHLLLVFPVLRFSETAPLTFRSNTPTAVSDTTIEIVLRFRRSEYIVVFIGVVIKRKQFLDFIQFAVLVGGCRRTVGVTVSSLIKWARARRNRFGGGSTNRDTGLLMMIPVQNTALKSPVLLFPRREYVIIIITFIILIIIRITWIFLLFIHLTIIFKGRWFRLVAYVTVSRPNERTATCPKSFGCRDRLRNGSMKRKTILLVRIGDAISETSLRFQRCKYIISVVVVSFIFLLVYFTISAGGFRRFFDEAVSRLQEKAAPCRRSFGQLQRFGDGGMETWIVRRMLVVVDRFEKSRRSKVVGGVAVVRPSASFILVCLFHVAPWPGWRQRAVLLRDLVQVTRWQRRRRRRARCRLMSVVWRIRRLGDWDSCTATAVRLTTSSGRRERYIRELTVTAVIACS